MAVKVMPESSPAESAPFAALSPDLVLAAIERLGFACDGRVLALNSYENRVYQVGLEAGAPLVAKFYRPARWTRAAILEEHEFSLSLAAGDVPVVAPLAIAGETLHQIGHYLYAVFERRGGRWPELGATEERVLMGRFLGRLHMVGAAGRFLHRRRLGTQEFGWQAREAVLECPFVPPYVIDKYADLTERLLERTDAALSAVAASQLRIHGDCHRGNILWTDAGPHFVDLDDCMTGPAIQDLWMLLAGTRDDLRRQLTDYLEGYEQFRHFDRFELALIEPLRALRLVHYAGWLAARWGDPAFPRAFPWFAEPRYWEDHLGALSEQLDALDADPLGL
jgi:Ser/Thr protein kinase RdoA (MazF antagonist)